jgi:branched-chain amino acid transport system permease protein
MYRPCGVFDTTYQQNFAIVRTPQHMILIVGGILILLSLPIFCSGGTLYFVNLVGILMISVQGLNVLVGFAGQISLGQAAFMAIGAYTSGLLTTYLHFSFWLALPCAAIITGLVGVLFGSPSLRIKGFYLAMATLAAQLIIPWFFANVRTDLTGGTNAMLVSAPHIGGWVLNSQQSMFYVIMPLTFLSLCLIRNLQRSRIGRAFFAIRDNELASEMMGVSLFKYKLLAFFICSFFAGLAGSIYAHWMRAISPDQFSLMESIWYLGMVIVGGMGSVIGVAFGVIFIKTVDTLITVLTPSLTGLFPPQLAQDAAAGLTPFVFGLIILLFLIFEPRGLSHRWEIIKAYFRLWPFKY